MRRLAFSLFWLAFSSGPVLAERLVLSLSSPQVAISSNFTGAEVAVFGVIERDRQSAARAGPYDIVITVRGPREAITIRRKDALGPLWINRDQQKFVSVPSLLGVYSTRPLSEITSLAMRRRARIGIEAIIASPDLTLERGGDDEPFRAALIRLKARDHLYAEPGAGVARVTETLFRAVIPLPATAPLGEYEIDAALLADGAVLGREEARFTVLKAGFEEQISAAARERPLAYGFGMAGLALAFGWLASIIFRRD
jgi:uncharacterized protein (TIGR02186 family)